jgi:cobalt-precorrin 5A hydrolase
MVVGEAMIVAGIGSRQGVEAAEVLALVQRALAEARVDRSMLSAIATAASKAEEPGIVSAAAQLGLSLLLISNDAMRAETGGVTDSPYSARFVGVASVSEASALAAAGQGSELILPRIKSATATCALAKAASAELPGQSRISDPIHRTRRQNTAHTHADAAPGAGACSIPSPPGERARVRGLAADTAGCGTVEHQSSAHIRSEPPHPARSHVEVKPETTRRADLSPRGEAQVEHADGSSRSQQELSGFEPGGRQ